MSNSLRLYHTIIEQLRQGLTDMRRTQIRSLAWMITGVYLSSHVHLSKVARHRPGPVKLDSKVQQLRRFLANPRIDVRACYEPYARGVLRAASVGGRLRLLIDVLELSAQRQILLVALAYRRRALPLIWEVRRRTGVSDAQSHIDLLARLRPWLPPQVEIVVLGDGEFHSVDLMAWLHQQGWHFRLRLHADTWVQLADGTWAQLQDLAPQEGERRYLQGVVLTQSKRFGPVNLALCWKQGEEQPWYLGTDQPASYLTLRDYQVRMWIEELFGDLQGSGFQLQLTRLRHPERLSRLILVLSLMYVCLLYLGTWLIKRGFRPLIDRRERRDRSLFQLGVLWIHRCLTNADPLRLRFGFNKVYGT
jgi:hypothetical protein